MTGSRTGTGNIQQEQEILQCQKVSVKSLSHIQLFVTPWTIAYQAPLPMGFFRQEYWSGWPFPSPLVFLDMHRVHMGANSEVSKTVPKLCTHRAQSFLVSF